MNDDQLDDEIRALMSAVVAEAPAAKPLPSMDDAPAAPVVSIRRSRGRAVVWTGIAVAASLAAFTVFWSSRNDNRSVTAATSSTVDQPPIASLTTTTAPTDRSMWPVGITAVVASNRGIETITAENGDPVVTRLSLDEWNYYPSHAVELADGSLVVEVCCDTNGATLVVLRAVDGTVTNISEGVASLMDVEADGSVLYIEDGRLMLWVDGVRRQLSLAPDIAGGLSPSFQFEGEIVVGAWDRGGENAFAVDRSGQPLEIGVAMGSVADANGPGMQEARIEGNGQLWVTNDSMQEIIDFDPDGVVGLDVSWPYVLVSYEDAPPVLVDATSGVIRELPVADGFATFSMKTPADPAPTVDFPDGDVRAVVTQRDTPDDGVWIVTDDEFVQVDSTAEGPAYLARDTLLFTPKDGGIVALDRTTGATQALRSTGHVVDAAVLGGQLYYLYAVSPVDKTTYLYLHGPTGDTFITTNFAYTDLGHINWHIGPGVIVGTSAYYSSLRPEFYDFAGNFLEDLSDQYAPATLPPEGNRMLYTMNPEGLWGIVDGDVLTLRQWGDPTVLDTITIPDGAQAIDLDVSADRIVVTYNLGTNGADVGREGTRTGDGTWTWSDLPGSGWATMPRASDPGSPFDVTPLTEPPYTPSVALAGDFGVKLIVGDGTEKVITPNPADQVLLHRNGAISFRSPGFGAYSQRWDPVTGESRSYWPGTNWFAEPNLHDDLGASDDFLFSVLDHVKRFSDERSWSTPGAADTRLSYCYDGWVIGNGVRFAMADSEPPEWLGAAGGEWALTPDGQLVASTTDGLIRVRRTSDGSVIYEQSIGDRVISQIDISGEWLAYVETPDDTPTADSSSQAVLVHLPSGRSLTYDGALSVSLANTDI